MEHTTSTPEALRAEAADLEQQAYDSFERCDTDGALSQWASGVTAQLRRAEAALLEAGGRARFPALFTLDGQLVPAWTVQAAYGPCFVVKAAWDVGGAVVAFVSRAKKQATYEKKGYRSGASSLPPAAGSTSDSPEGQRRRTGLLTGRPKS